MEWKEWVPFLIYILNSILAHHLYPRGHKKNLHPSVLVSHLKIFLVLTQKEEVVEEEEVEAVV